MYIIRTYTFIFIAFVCVCTYAKSRHSKILLIIQEATCREQETQSQLWVKSSRGLIRKRIRKNVGEKEAKKEEKKKKRKKNSREEMRQGGAKRVSYTENIHIIRKRVLFNPFDLRSRQLALFCNKYYCMRNLRWTPHKVSQKGHTIRKPENKQKWLGYEEGVFKNFLSHINT